MPRLFPALALAALAGGLSLAVAQSPPKDTPLAAKTRDGKLKAKLSVDFKNEMLRTIMEEISGQLQDQKLGALSIDYATGVSRNSRLSITAKDKPLEEILDELLKPLDLGYVVVSKAGDRYDGWLRITKGPERGYEAGAEGKGVAKKGEKVEKAEKKMPAKGKKGPDPEAAAAALLKNAQSYVTLGRKPQAKEKLKELLEKYPDSKAAAEAKELLEKLDQ